VTPALAVALDAVCCLIAAGGVFVWQTSTDERYRNRWH
jgi:hypothetical protein